MAIDRDTVIRLADKANVWFALTGEARTRDLDRLERFANLIAQEQMMRDYARAALASRQAPEEWKWVPVEPSEAMLDRAVAFGLNVSLSKDYGWTPYMRDLWATMLAASPSSPSTGEEPGGACARCGGWVVDPVIQQEASPSADARALPPAIAAIAERLHTQDNRITAHPLFAVQQKRRIYGLDADYRDGTVFIDDEGIEFAECDSVEHGCREVGYRDTWEFVTGCFTEQGCKDYIAANGHNLNEPRIYAYGSYRNAEFIALREWLMAQVKENTNV